MLFSTKIIILPNSESILNTNNYNLVKHWQRKKWGYFSLSFSENILYPLILSHRKSWSVTDNVQLVIIGNKASCKTSILQFSTLHLSTSMCLLWTLCSPTTYFPSFEYTVYILLKNSWAIQCEDIHSHQYTHSKYPLGYRKLAKLTFIGLAKLNHALFFLLLSL